MIIKNVGLLLIAIFRVNTVSCEIFSSLVDVEKMSDVEEMIIGNMKAYIAKLEAKINYLNREIKMHEQLQSNKLINALSNPVEVFLMMKRLTIDQQKLEQFVLVDDSRDGFFLNLTKAKSSNYYPSENDLIGAAVAIRRLQKTYNLNTTDIANGILNGVNSSLSMSAEDCYQLANVLFNKLDFVYSAKWMKEALDRYDKNKDSHLSEVEMLRQVIMAHDIEGNPKIGLEMINRLTKLTPYDPQVDVLRAKFEEKILTGVTQEEQHFPEPKIDPKHPLRYDNIDKYHYERLCRSEIKRSPKQLASLRCRLVHNNKPFYKIGPVRVEELSIDPYIVFYYNILYDSEIQILKDLSIPKFERSEIYSGSIDELRVSKTGWVDDLEDEKIAKLSKRVSDVTALSLSTAEGYQVVNYGLAGHYEPHLDWTGDKTCKKLHQDGNRIATFLIYMSDVIQGGATVFPFVNIAAYPVKGAALFWYNLYKSGRGDIRSKHASCPVVIGTKWVANKWFHEIGQELIKPCDLQPDHPKENDYDW